MGTLLKDLRNKYPHISIEVEQTEGTDKYRVEIESATAMEIKDTQETLGNYVIEWGFGWI